MAFVEWQLRDAVIVVPFIDNDNEALGYWAPGTGEGSVDIYGIDPYPMRYDCAHPSIWPTYRFPRDWQIMHEETSLSTPFAIPEFQGGSGTGWGPDSVNQDGCNALVNEESVRVLYKNNYSFGVRISTSTRYYQPEQPANDVKVSQRLHILHRVLQYFVAALGSQTSHFNVRGHRVKLLNICMTYGGTN
jgi:hypothetical protein